MPTEVEIGPQLPDLPPVQHGSERVLTTELLAKVYGTEAKTLQDNFEGNRARFTAGIHYYDLSPGELRAFKNSPDFVGLVGKQARSLRLWTERGAARHAKMLSTDAAWAIFGKLEETYFDRPGAEPPASAMPASPKAAIATFKAYSSFGKLIGLDENQTILRANRATHRACGVDLLADMGQPLIEAPQQELLLTATELGMKLGGKSARTTNLLLTEHGFQTRHQTAKGEARYEATELGKTYSRIIDVDKSQGGAPVLQLRWYTTVVQPLEAAMVERV